MELLRPQVTKSQVQSISTKIHPRVFINHTLNCEQQLFLCPTSPLNITFYIEICTNSVNQPAGLEIGGLTMILGVEPQRLTRTDPMCTGRNIFLSVK